MSNSPQTSVVGNMAAEVVTKSIEALANADRRGILGNFSPKCSSQSRIAFV
jgi:hypothetical protein